MPVPYVHINVPAGSGECRLSVLEVTSIACVPACQFLPGFWDPRSFTGKRELCCVSVYLWGETLYQGFGVYVCDGRVGVKTGKKEGRRGSSSSISSPERFENLLKPGFFLNQHVLPKRPH